MSLRRSVTLSLLSAMAFLLMFLVEFPIPPFPPFLKYDPGDIPALFATLAYGPGAGVLVQFIKAALFFFSGKSTAGIIGVTANFMTGASLVMGFGTGYRVFRSARPVTRFVLSCVIGSISMAVVMCVLNYFVFFPLWGIDKSELLTMVLTVALPFNLVKGAITSATSWAIYLAVVSRSELRSLLQLSATLSPSKK